jgi:hypothetical protein
MRIAQGAAMLMARLPIAVLMQRRQPSHPWAEPTWEAVAVLAQPAAQPAPDAAPSILLRRQSGDAEICLTSGLALELFPDENDGYFENWVAPQPKVFLMWRVQQDDPVPVIASVSYAEGTRMLDSGEAAGGVAMPPDIHAWLGEYLRAHYTPPAQGRRRHG